MKPLVLRWLKANQGKWFESPRVPAFNRRRVPDDFMITYVDESDRRVGIQFRKSKYPALPLHFWMFTRTLQHLQTSPGFAPIGAAVRPPYIQTRAPYVIFALNREGLCGVISVAFWVPRSHVYPQGTFLWAPLFRK
jgi:hypothetical protein